MKIIILHYETHPADLLLMTSIAKLVLILQINKYQLNQGEEEWLLQAKWQGASELVREDSGRCEPRETASHL